MSYLQAQTDALIQVLDHAADLKAHRLAGYIANLDFWLQEIQHCFSSIEGYSERFQRMKQGAADYLQDHPDEHGEPPNEGYVYDGDTRTTRGLRNTDLKGLRATLQQSACRFFRRCYKAGLISLDTIEDAEKRLGFRLRT
jgi:hypothetical protein